MLYFFKPYSFNEKLFDAFDHYFSLLPNDNDWACIMDGDTMFLRSDFGHTIQAYIDKYPDTGIFSSYASRCAYNYQVPKQVNQKNTDLLFHIKTANLHHLHQELEIREINRPIAGHLWVMQKKIWLSIRQEVKRKTMNETFEGIDTAIAKEILLRKLPVRIMKQLYIVHLFRLGMAAARKAPHLGYKDFITIITPCSRPENLHKIKESINIPYKTHQWVIVFDAPSGTIDPKLIPDRAKPMYHQDKESVAGHAQRNHALQHHQFKEGLIYFLDDDNILHPDFYKEVSKYDMQYDIIHFNQEDNKGRHRVGGQIEVDKIDTANLTFSTRILGTTRFRKNLYNADGYFFKALSNKTQNIHYIPKTLAYYNKLITPSAAATRRLSGVEAKKPKPGG